MDYGQQIMSILYDVGERGISARLLTRHVYNMNRTLFAEPDIAEVRDYVRKFLRRQFKAANPMLERTGKRGYYRLTSNYIAKARLSLQFTNDTEPDIEDKEDVPAQDFTLSLFND